MALSSQSAISVTKDVGTAAQNVLTPEALEFLAKLHHKFNPRRQELLQARLTRQTQLNQGVMPTFLREKEGIRRDPEWQIKQPPADMQKRWVEITGPTDRKMMINALNSGADVFMADFEDANSPTWLNMVEGQHNLQEAVNGTLAFSTAEGKQYRLNEKRAVLCVRPRGWHLLEKHLLITGKPISASLFDFGLAFFHNAKALLKQGSGPYFYLPKLESHLEARLWNDVFLFAQQELGLPIGTIRATVLIETIPAVFEMEEILYELHEHILGLNAGRWDYIFSIIKKFHKRRDLLLPDRAQITMTVPFMRAYTDLLVQTCHKRGAHAMGGMAAFVPSRKDSQINEAALTKVREDKLRESADGFDGTWVAHPDLVKVAHDVFSQALKNQAHQVHRLRNDVHANAETLLNFHIPNGTITEKGVRQNISVALQYLNAWLNGIGAAAIFNLMEDVATAEISRAQLWQWVHHPAAIMEDGRRITAEVYKRFADEELATIEAVYTQPHQTGQKLQKARSLLDQLVLKETFEDFLTLPAYDLLE